MPLDVSDVDRFANRLTAQAAVIPVRVREVVTATAYLIEGDAKMLAPVAPGFVVSHDAVADCAVRPTTAEWARFVTACDLLRETHAKPA